MTVTPDDDFAAAEYALGTLDPAERATLAARRLREPELDQAIRAWEARLAPLAEATPAIEPPRDLLACDRGADSRRFRCGPAAYGGFNRGRAATQRDTLARGGDRRVGRRGDAGDQALAFARRRGRRSRANTWRSCRRTPLRPPSR